MLTVTLRNLEPDLNRTVELTHHPREGVLEIGLRMEDRPDPAWLRHDRGQSRSGKRQHQAIVHDQRAVPPRGRRDWRWGRDPIGVPGCVRWVRSSPPGVVVAGLRPLPPGAA